VIKIDYTDYMSIYTLNKQARFDYEILETLEAGIVLSGMEVKAVRNHLANLKGAFVTFHGDEAWLINLHISRYAHTSLLIPYEPTRSRKLLLKKKQIDYLRGKSQQQGLTIIPLSLYTKGRHIKVEIAVGKGKKKYDKRKTVRDREIKRTVQRAIKEQR